MREVPLSISEYDFVIKALTDNLVCSSLINKKLNALFNGSFIEKQFVSICCLNLNLKENRS